MNGSPASGERNALRGYRWQYDQLASIVYDSLLNDTFLSLRLTDPEVGTVDDLVLVTTNGPVGHQFKSEELAGSITFKDLLKERRSRSNRPVPSWLRSLASGWLALGGAAAGASVCLVTNQWPSVSDHVVPPENPIRPTPDNFANFVRRVLNPISSGDLRFEDVPGEWTSALERMRSDLGFEASAFALFIRSLRLHLAQTDPLRTSTPVRRSDIQDLSDILCRTVSNSDEVVVLNRAEVLELAGWTHRVRLRNAHQFPVDLDTYEPLSAAIDELRGLVAQTTQGYVALLGPPGCGKSTLLSQLVIAGNDRIVRYCAYVPGPTNTRTRSGARGFLHDVVFLLEQGANKRGHLLERNEDELREALVVLLEAASHTYLATGTRTLIVIDGLDHVERDHPGDDSLLRELPRPEQIPRGVVFLVGTRTLSPLPPEARQDLDESIRHINLQDHRLPLHSVIAICRRFSTTANFGPPVHERIADLADGHPLSLAYLLNKIGDAESDSTALEMLSAIPVYTGDITQQYRAIWEALRDRPQAQELLATVARLRIPFEDDDLLHWFDPQTYRAFREDLDYLFRPAGVTKSFFHDSFRQFVTAQSNPDFRASAVGQPMEAAYHRQIAELCSRAARPALKWEELYHRYRAGEGILSLATQELFREQVRSMRSPLVVREDLAIVLRQASERRDTVALIGATLAKSEAESRWSRLEEIDVPKALLDADMPASAVAYAGIEHGRHVPLAQAYRLASRLGFSGSADGRRVFDAVEPALFDDPEFRTFAGQEDQVYDEWAYAAPIYRALSTVLGIAEQLHPTGQSDADDWRSKRAIRRFAQVADQIGESLADLGRYSDLDRVEELLVRILGTHYGDDSPWGEATHLHNSRLRIKTLLISGTTDAEEAVNIFEAGLSLAKSVGLYSDMLLSWAELALQFERPDDAAALLSRAKLNAQLDSRDLGYSKDGTIGERFRYWRLRHRVLYRRSPDLSGRVLKSVPTSDATPAGNEIKASAPAHRYARAIDLIRNVDSIVRTLAAVAAAKDEGADINDGSLTTVTLRTLNLFRRIARESSQTLGVRSHRLDILKTLTAVVIHRGRESTEILASQLRDQFTADRKLWPVAFRMTLGEQLHAAGVTPDWYLDALAEAEVEITSGALDLDGRLERAVELTRHLSALDRLQDARRLATDLVYLSFGVGYRKDHQFSTWVDWLHRATDSGLETPYVDIVALGQLLTAAVPMTEGAPRHAAERLPAILAGSNPALGVALFEQLVRKGTVDHLEALSRLIPVIANQLEPDEVVVNAVVDLTDLVARASSVAQPELCARVADYCRSSLEPAVASTVINDLTDRIRKHALPTSRASWLEPQGVLPTDPPTQDSGDTSGGLELHDGSHLTQAQGLALITDAQGLIELQTNANLGSTFPWSRAIDKVACDQQQLAQIQELFGDLTSSSDARVHIALGKKWLEIGDRTSALAQATSALSIAHKAGWGPEWGCAKIDAHRLAIAAGGDAERSRAWRDVAESVGSETWLSDTVLDNLDEIAKMLDPGASPIDVWRLIRVHLDGFAATLNLETDDPVDSQPIRWWFPGASLNVSRIGVSSTAARALGVLLIDHATHPEWVVRDAAIAAAARALGDGFPDLISIIDDVLRAEPPDDTVEALGRIVYCSSAGSITSLAMNRIHSILGSHPNQFVRELSLTPSNKRASLPAKYRLVLPPGGGALVGASESGLGPYEDLVRLCAFAADLDDDNIVEHALIMMSEQAGHLPINADACKALDAASMNHRLPHFDLFASRAAAGRLARDFWAAGFLDDLSGRDEAALRSFDAGLVKRSPGPRPSVVPAAPLAGHDTTLESWLAGAPDRLNEYVGALAQSDEFVVAATARAAVLNWARAEEKFVCTTVLGEEKDLLAEKDSGPTPVYDRLRSDLSGPFRPREPGSGDNLAIENWAWSYHQIQTDWIAFSPWVAAYLGWTLLSDGPGVYVNSDDDITLRVIEWVDGWPGHGSRSFDDTEGAGTLIVATSVGIEALRSLGALTRTSRIHRWAEESSDGQIHFDERVEHRAEAVLQEPH